MTLRRALRRTDSQTASPDDAGTARARILITLAWSTTYLHGRDQALALLQQVRDSAQTPRLRALSHVQEAVVHVSCAEWQAAIDALARVGEDFVLLTPREQVAALINGGLAHLSLLNLEPARVELRRALDLAVEHSMPEQEFKARHNLGCLEFYAGRFPEAIRLMGAADEADVPVQRARAKHDLALALLEAGLLDRAHATLRSALVEAKAEGLRHEEGDIHLDLARCSLLLDRPDNARRELDAAVAAYRSRGATARQRSARLQRAALAVETGRVPHGIESLLAHWRPEAPPVTSEERLAARVRAEVSLLRGDVATAEAAVARLRRRPRQGIADELHDRLVVARVKAAAGQRPAARRVVRDGITRLAARQELAQSLEVRSALALHGRRLAEFELEDALRGGSPARVFDSVERWRAVSHRLGPVSAEPDAQRVELLAELRRARHLLAGSDLPDGKERDRLREKAVRLEWQVARSDWATADEGPGAPPTRPASLHRVRSLLASREEAAVVLFDHDGQQYALHVHDDRARLHALGPARHITDLASRLNRDLRAHAFAAPNPGLEQAVQRAVDSSLRALDSALFGSVTVAPTRGLVVVPGRTLASVPWSLLPSLAGRPITVAPSMTRWANGTRIADERVSTTVGALAGPGLAWAPAEVEEVASVWRQRGAATSGREADSADVKEALRTHRLVHIAAHGTHEDQSPFFSSLRMCDGPVFAHELPRPLAAQHVVLSACEVGRSELRAGDEPLGLTAALLALGARSVVAAVAPVRDEVASRAMVSYHRQLASGRAASAALAAAVAEHPGAGAFCLFGADWSPAR